MTFVRLSDNGNARSYSTGALKGTRTVLVVHLRRLVAIVLRSVRYEYEQQTQCECLVGHVAVFRDMATSRYTVVCSTLKHIE
jgi:hypothetical protein